MSKPTVRELYPINIDRAMGWDKLLKQTQHKPGNVSRNFTKVRFPLGQSPDYEYDLLLVEFDHDPSWEEILAEIVKQELKRPEPEDLLVFAATYPDVQLEFPIVAPIASPWLNEHGNECVPYLDGLEGVRYLSVSRPIDDWRQSSRFMARKPRKKTKLK